MMFYVTGDKSRWVFLTNYKVGVVGEHLSRRMSCSLFSFWMGQVSKEEEVRESAGRCNCVSCSCVCDICMKCAGIKSRPSLRASHCRNSVRQRLTSCAFLASDGVYGVHGGNFKAGKIENGEQTMVELVAHPFSSFLVRSLHVGPFSAGLRRGVG